MSLLTRDPTDILAAAALASDLLKADTPPVTLLDPSVTVLPSRLSSIPIITLEIVKANPDLQWDWRRASTVDTSSISTGSVVLSGGLGLNGSASLAKNLNFFGSSSGSGGISGNMLVMLDSNRLSPPLLSTGYSGTRYVLLSAITTSAASSAIGLESECNWYVTSSPQSGSKWYSDATNLLTLDGNGTLTIKGTTANTSYGTGSLLILGGASIGSATNGVVNLVAPASSTSPTFTLPASLTTQARQVFVSDAYVSLMSTPPPTT
ncbi:hypothetical protein BDK51DRAFT_40266 [Blyttiomyces helicus]|uniref:Uncharacterized protein n=1 Tax=Blyttiomyces helicus TaxID=388810 RepID=A0A4P9WRN8_9FUNG|nr:hypothetical protein BDK51DRAFT_40266 [Blyttiomyces helicus]|eukprot:RKO94558.1 hypothetical protein BDK51DRAFT_40266 [Blyttiomyces helicus]